MNANTTRKRGTHPLQSVVAAFRVQIYITAADVLDENLQVLRTAFVESLKGFCKGILSSFEDTYFCSPSQNDSNARIISVSFIRRFPFCIG